jgi:hypothetical protein
LLLFLPPIDAGGFSTGCIETEHVIKFVQFSLDASSYALVQSVMRLTQKDTTLVDMSAVFAHFCTEVVQMGKHTHPQQLKSWRLLKLRFMQFWKRAWLD